MALGTTNTTSYLQNPGYIDFGGIWQQQNQTSPQLLMTHPLPTLQLQIVLVFFFAQAIHLLLLKHVGLPDIVSQLLVGILLGPSFIGSNTEFRETLFKIDSQQVLGVVAALGYLLFIFTIAVKIDVKMVLKTGKRATLVGILSVLAPLIIGMLVENTLQKTLKLHNIHDNIPFIAMIISITPFPVIAKTLGDLQILNSELGRLTLSAALVGDMGSVALTSVATMIHSTNVHVSLVGQFGFLLYTIVFICFAAFVFRPVMFWVIAQTPKGGQVEEKYICGIMVCVFGSGVVTHLFGQFAFFGPFILGLAIPEGPPLGTALTDRLDCISSYVIQPIFVAIAGMRTDFGSLKGQTKLIVIDVLLISATLATKILSCFVVSVQGGMPVKDSLAFSVLMSAKGVVELTTYSYLRDTRMISETTFTVLNMSILLTTIVVPVMVRRLHNSSRKYANYQRRNVSFLRPNSELRMLISIHSLEKIPDMINFVETVSPKPEKPVSLYVLHLIKLTGRALPVFISHKIQTKLSTSFSYYDNVAALFDRYRQQIHPEEGGGLTISAFTAISPPESMHEDICTLALDKRTSLIILPFHQSRSSKGRILSDDKTLRALNRSVLERAPCSVGILVDRSSSRIIKRNKKQISSTTTSSSSNHQTVAVIFIGGDDDREALTLAKRMVRGGGASGVNLTVIRLVAKDDDGGLTEWEKILDFEALKELMKEKQSNSDGGGDEMSVEGCYVEEAVKDGQETWRVLKRVAEDYELIIVGRRNGVVSPQTNGLLEWTVFPELGLLGDLLASPDLHSKASILVVQQQLQIK